MPPRPAAGRSLAAALLTAGLAPLLPTAPLAGQAPDSLPAAQGPAWPFPPPAVSAMEPRTRLAPVWISRGDRQGWVGLVDLGHRFPVWLRRPPSPTADGRDAHPALAASIAGGAFSRFDLEAGSNDFIEVHYRVGLRLLGRLGGLEARGELYHVSSHLGDEFLQRTSRDPVSTSREGLELLVGGSPVDRLRIYGGPGLVLRSTRAFEAGSLRAGAEWGPAPRRGAFRPYLGIEVFAWEELGWRPMAAAEAGLRVGRRYRLALTAGAGSSRAEQFFRENETLLGLTVSADF